MPLAQQQDSQRPNTAGKLRSRQHGRACRPMRSRLPHNTLYSNLQQQRHATPLRTMSLLLLQHRRSKTLASQL